MERIRKCQETNVSKITIVVHKVPKKCPCSKTRVEEWKNELRHVAENKDNLKIRE